MPPGISYITLPCDDLERLVAFYRDGFGFPLRSLHPPSRPEDDGWAFFELGDQVLALFDRRALAREAACDIVAGGSGIALSHNIGSAEAVDRLMQRLQRAGATITRPAGHSPWGVYRGYLKDPEGHLWEIVWSPKRHPVT